jgi:hypothetical protein
MLLSPNISAGTPCALHQRRMRTRPGSAYPSITTARTECSRIHRMTRPPLIQFHSACRGALWVLELSPLPNMTGPTSSGTRNGQGALLNSCV